MHLKVFIQVTWFRGCWKEKILVFQIHLIICHQVQLILVTWVISEEEFGERMFNQSTGDIYFDFYFKCGRYLESCECGWTYAGLIGNDTVLLFRQPNFHSLCGQFLLGLVFTCFLQNGYNDRALSSLLHAFKANSLYPMCRTLNFFLLNFFCWFWPFAPLVKIF